MLFFIYCRTSKYPLFTTIRLSCLLFCMSKYCYFWSAIESHCDLCRNLVHYSYVHPGVLIHISYHHVIYKFCLPKHILFKQSFLSDYYYAFLPLIPITGFLAFMASVTEQGPVTVKMENMTQDLHWGLVHTTKNTLQIHSRWVSACAFFTFWMHFRMHCRCCYSGFFFTVLGSGAFLICFDAFQWVFPHSSTV